MKTYQGFESLPHRQILKSPAYGRAFCISTPVPKTSTRLLDDRGALASLSPPPHCRHKFLSPRTISIPCHTANLAPEYRCLRH
ncbi:hypothetical protein ACM3CZ_17850 [Edwardsiella ictaluri]